MENEQQSPKKESESAELPAEESSTSQEEESAKKREGEEELEDYLKEKENILGKKESEKKAEPDVVKEQESGMLVPEESYLTAGVHIGTQQKSAHMKPFLYRVRNDGLFVLNVKMTDKKLQIAAKFLARYKPEEILVVSARQYGQRAVRKMAEILGNHVLPGRFVPGTLTNPNISQYLEPKVIVVTDPAADAQAMREAISIGIPIVGICDANNVPKYVDLVVPGNNKGRKALALMYYLLTAAILMEKGEISELSEFNYKPEDFEEPL